jgi:prepilin-type N-terminal cleavage/methylation domain-containing protein
LLQRLREARRNESGFTLIELLIVIVILGVLSGIVVFAVGAITDTGTVAACKADKKAVEVASEAYFAQNHEYAAAAGATGADNLLVTATPKGFLKEVPENKSYTILYKTGGVVESTGC